jgi:hypothetical protein
MKTEKIRINKTPDNPEGTELEVVFAENRLEERLLSFLMNVYVREMKRENLIPYEIPNGASVDYRGGGTFVLSGFLNEGNLYEPPRPIAIFGIRPVDNRFDLIHAPVPQQPRTPQPVTQPLANSESTNTTTG